MPPSSRSPPLPLLCALLLFLLPLSVRSLGNRGPRDVIEKIMETPWQHLRQSSHNFHTFLPFLSLDPSDPDYLTEDALESSMQSLFFSQLKSDSYLYSASLTLSTGLYLSVSRDVLLPVSSPPAQSYVLSYSDPSTPLFASKLDAQTGRRLTSTPPLFELPVGGAFDAEVDAPHYEEVYGHYLKAVEGDEEDTTFPRLPNDPLPGYWSSPFMSPPDVPSLSKLFGDPSANATELLISLSVPLYSFPPDSAGASSAAATFFGVLTVDVDLKCIEDYLSSLTELSNGHSFYSVFETNTTAPLLIATTVFDVPLLTSVAASSPGAASASDLRRTSVADHSLTPPESGRRLASSPYGDTLFAWLLMMGYVQDVYPNPLGDRIVYNHESRFDVQVYHYDGGDVLQSGGGMTSLAVLPVGAPRWSVISTTITTYDLSWISKADPNPRIQRDYYFVMSLIFFTFSFSASCLIFLCYFRKTNVIKLSQPTFLGLLPFGGMGISLSMNLFIGHPTKYGCMFRFFSLNIMFTFTFSALLWKNHRAWMVARAAKYLQKIKFSNADVYKYIGLLTFADVLFNVLSLKFETMRPQHQYQLLNRGISNSFTGVIESEEMFTCGIDGSTKTNANWGYALLCSFLLKLALLIFGIVIILRTRTFDVQYAESNALLMTIYTVAMTGGALYFSGYAASPNQQTKLWTGGLSFNVVVAFSFIYMPRAAQLFFRGDITKEELLAKTQKMTLGAKTSQVGGKMSSGGGGGGNSSDRASHIGGRVSSDSLGSTAAAGTSPSLNAKESGLASVVSSSASPNVYASRRQSTRPISTSGSNVSQVADRGNLSPRRDSSRDKGGGAPRIPLTQGMSDIEMQANPMAKSSDKEDEVIDASMPSPLPLGDSSPAVGHGENPKARLSGTAFRGTFQPLKSIADLGRSAGNKLKRAQDAASNVFHPKASAMSSDDVDWR